MRHPDIADRSTRTDGIDRLRHGFLRTDALQDGVRTDPGRELFHALYPQGPSFGHDVGRAEVSRQFLPALKVAPRCVVTEIARGLVREGTASFFRKPARQVGDFLVGRIVLDTEIQRQHRREFAGGRIVLQRYREGLIRETATDTHGRRSSGLCLNSRRFGERGLRH